jgi:hypothetical protein
MLEPSGNVLRAYQDADQAMLPPLERDLLLLIPAKAVAWIEQSVGRDTARGKSTRSPFVILSKSPRLVCW